MGKSKWNNRKSYVISELSESELKEAMPEWAEGSQYLEELLWECHRNGIVTNGCDDRGHEGYLGVTIRDSSEKLRYLLGGTWNFENSEISLDFGGNPYSGNDWYKTCLTVAPNGPCDMNEFWSFLVEALKNQDGHNCDNAFMQVYPINEFFEGKEAGLSVRFIREGNHRKLTVRCWRNKKFFASLFETIGLKYEGEFGRDARWSFLTEDEETLKHCAQQFLEVLKANWTLELPTEIDADMDLADVALMMRRKFGTNPDGIEAFNTWLEESRKA